MIQAVLDFTSPSPINKEKFSRQNRQVFDVLDSGETIDVLKAIHMGIFHLHSRISDLRNKHGVVIYDRMINREGINCKEYSFKPFSHAIKVSRPVSTGGVL